MNIEALIFGMQCIFLGSAIGHLLLATVLWEKVSRKLLFWYYQKVISRIENNRLTSEMFEKRAKKLLYSTVFLMLFVWLFLLTDSAKEQIGMYF